MKRKAQIGFTQWEAKRLLEIVNFYTEQACIGAESPMAYFLLQLTPRLERIAKVEGR